ncbi:hypothetical protein ACLB2K_048009 [Fragaria x ananassa]
MVENMVLEGGKLMAHESSTAVDGIDGVVEHLVLRFEGFILGLEAIYGCLKVVRWSVVMVNEAVELFWGGRVVFWVVGRGGTTPLTSAGDGCRTWLPRIRPGL